jgi:deoxyribodipyrimidine photo-lyase
MKDLIAFGLEPRITMRSAGCPNPQGRCVVYWMQRSQRAFDNPALNVAIRVGNLVGKPVVVFFQLVPRSHHANLRHYYFLVQGLRDIAVGLEKRGVGFVLRRYPEHGILKFLSEVQPSLVIGDENPMREADQSKAKAARDFSAPFWTVDADVIVPSKLLGKEHYAARTIRPKIHALLPQFLRPFANPLARVAWKKPRDLNSMEPDLSLLDNFTVDRSVGPVPSRVGGSEQGRNALQQFLKFRLKGYATNRNHPDLDGTSQLSPYLHFGHIGVHTVALAVKNARAPLPDRKAFLEELIVRRELAVNFVRFNSNYENFDSSEPWADRSLRIHLGDDRKYLYTERQLESAETHDPLWNAAQKQMILAGWMHGYLRMYWAKKILEWSPSPEVAYDVAVRLNDRYELDGRDPNGYAGIAWAIVGKHDRAWGPERPVYGKIRYMSYASTSRKFNSKAYIERIAALERGRL